MSETEHKSIHLHFFVRVPGVSFFFGLVLCLFFTEFFVFTEFSVCVCVPLGGRFAFNQWEGRKRKTKTKRGRPWSIDRVTTAILFLFSSSSLFVAFFCFIFSILRWGFVLKGKPYRKRAVSFFLWLSSSFLFFFFIPSFRFRGFT